MIDVHNYITLIYSNVYVSFSHMGGAATYEMCSHISGMCSHVSGMCSHISRMCSHIYDGESENNSYLSQAGAWLSLANVKSVLGVAFNISYQNSSFLCFMFIFLYILYFSTVIALSIKTCHALAIKDLGNFCRLQKIWRRMSNNQCFSYRFSHVENPDNVIRKANKRAIKCHNK